MRSDSREQSKSPASKRSSSSSLLRTGQSYLERLGVLYHDQIRLAIVTELYMREMSPKQFFEQVGGTSYDSVRRHFLKLVEHGWLRRVRPSPSRRGRPEQLYRATELAIIDDETWAEIPISIRDSFTARLVDEMGDWVAKSLTTGTYESRSGTMSFSSMSLDEVGWTEAIETLNRCFRSLAHEQTDAKVRLEQAQGAGGLMIVELGGFEMPHNSEEVPLALPPASPAPGAPPWPPRIAKVFSDPLNLAIIRLLNASTMSPTQLHGALGGTSVEGFDRRCKSLTNLGWAARVDSMTGGYRRGATENFYRATCPAVTEAEILSRVPMEARHGDGWQEFEAFCEGAISAIRGGTFNARDDRHLTLSRLSVDEIGWSQVISSLAACAKSLSKIQQAAGSRLKRLSEVKAARVGFLIGGFACPDGVLEVYRQLG